MEDEYQEQSDNDEEDEEGNQTGEGFYQDPNESDYNRPAAVMLTSDPNCKSKRTSEFCSICRRLVTDKVVPSIHSYSRLRTVHTVHWADNLHTISTYTTIYRTVTGNGSGQKRLSSLETYLSYLPFFYSVLAAVERNNELLSSLLKEVRTISSSQNGKCSNVEK